MSAHPNPDIVQRLDAHMARAVSKGNTRAAVLNSTRGMISASTPPSFRPPWEHDNTATLTAFAEKVATRGGTTTDLLAAIKQDYGQEVYEVYMTALNSNDFARQLAYLEGQGL